MHEFGLMKDALGIALDHVRRQGATRIHRLSLRVGSLSGVVPEALRFAFAAMQTGTPAEGAALDIEEVTITCHCATCERTFHPADVVFACPHCETVCAGWQQGQELELTSIEVS